MLFVHDTHTVLQFQHHNNISSSSSGLNILRRMSFQISTTIPVSFLDVQLQKGLKMSSGVKLLLLVLLAVSYCRAKNDAPIIELSEGKIKGEEKESREDKDFFAYRGIPYARPPVGDLRFEPPQPPGNWSGVKETDDYEKECLQYDFFAKKVKGEEDCLYLNVFTPRYGEGVSKKLLPVMVYIHGGFFMSGSANHYKPNYFMDHEVVMVTFNYRVGALGFLNTYDGTIRGNMGLKDQVMALRWVQKNIRKFGGDPNRVTIFGEGAGASSVHYHLLSPMSKGLFHRAISQSGTVLNPYAFQPHPAEASRRLGWQLKCGSTFNSTVEDYLGNTTLLLNCLRSINAKKIAEKHEETWDPLRHPLSTFLPSVEVGKGLPNETFLSQHPFSLLVTGKQRRVPWIVGFNADEGLLTTAKISNDKDLTGKVENNWKNFAGRFLVYDNSRTDITDAIRSFYIDQAEVPSVTPTTTTTTPAPLPVPTAQANLVPSLYPTLPPINGSIRRDLGLSTISPLPQQPLPTPIIHPSSSIVAPSAQYALESFDNEIINFEEKFPQFTRLFTDRLFSASILKVVQIQSKLSPIFLYYNNYKGQFSFFDVYAGKEKEPVPAMKKVSTWFKTKLLGRTVQQPKHMGVCHSDELPLLFKYSEAKVKDHTKDYTMSKDLVQLWLQFASTNENNMLFRNITWLPVDPSQEYANNALQFANDDKDVKILTPFYYDTTRFWNSLSYLAPFQQ